MEANKEQKLMYKLKRLFIGKPRDIQDQSIFHKMALIAFFAWIGLGADGLSSSCYGPQEAFLTLGEYHYLGIFVALGTAFAILIISTSYSQTIELFPSGGGGYLVASKLHSPFVGMISGCALIIDYILTIATSITSGIDAIFSFLPADYGLFKIESIVIVGALLILINLRGVKESIFILAPIFMIFVLTHLYGLSYTFITHFSDFDKVADATSLNISQAQRDLGFYGMIFLILKAFSMGAGTFTGIEAVSNGLPVLREPKIKTGKRTMKYMAISLSLTALGIMCAYFLYSVTPVEGKTLNAVLFEKMSIDWGFYGQIFIWITLFSEGAILFVAAQSGFIDGPRVISNMALDQWMPTRFSMLSDRLVTKNGIILVGLAAIIVTLLTDGKIELLLILYSINVFITFSLTESGMIRHWLQVRKVEKKWLKKIIIHIIAFTIDIFILSAVVIMKFNEGGWITIFVTGLLVTTCWLVKKHYKKVSKSLSSKTKLTDIADDVFPFKNENFVPSINVGFEKTAFILVNGYNDLGLHTLFNIMKTFGNIFHRYIFIQVGIMDAGNFKGVGDTEKLYVHLKNETQKYVELMNRNGFNAESYTSIGIDILEELEKIILELRYYYPDCVVFGGQLLFKKETLFTGFLHNNIIFSLQKKLFPNTIPMMVMPIKI